MTVTAKVERSCRRVSANAFAFHSCNETPVRQSNITGAILRVKVRLCVFRVTRPDSGCKTVCVSWMQNSGSDVIETRLVLHSTKTRRWSEIDLLLSIMISRSVALSEHHGWRADKIFLNWFHVKLKLLPSTNKNTK